MFSTSFLDDFEYAPGAKRGSRGTLLFVVFNINLVPKRGLPQKSEERVLSVFWPSLEAQADYVKMLQKRGPLLEPRRDLGRLISGPAFRCLFWSPFSGASGCAVAKKGESFFALFNINELVI